MLLQVLTPIQTAISHNLGDRTAAYLYDRLTEACVRPQGMGHLEDPALIGDLTVARDFDLGMTGPPLSYSMDFIAGGLVGMIGGLAAAVVLFGFSWWAPPLLAGAWLATHWLLRESAVWQRPQHRRSAHARSAMPTTRIGSRSIRPRARSCGCSGSCAGPSIDSSHAARVCTSCSTTRRACASGRSSGVLLIVTAANVIVLWALVSAAAAGRIDLGEIVVYAQCAVGTSMIAFGGLNWALDGASAPVAAVRRLVPAMAALAASSRDGDRRAACPRDRFAFAT